MTAPAPIDLAEKLGQVDKTWTPHRIATFDRYQLFVARLDGEFVWHDHREHDETFLCLEGELLLDFEGDQTVRLRPGQLLVVPAGVRHRPRTEGGECRVLVIDPQEMQHTGGVDSDLTVHEYPEI